MNAENPPVASPIPATLAEAGLDTLDSSWLSACLAGCIWRDDEIPGTVHQVRISQPRHTSGGPSALVTISLSGPDGAVVEQTYVAQRFDAANVRAEYESAIRTATIVPPIGRAVTLCRDAGLVLVAFPNDRRMRWLSERDLRAWLADRAATLADGGSAGTWRLRDARIGILRYVPGQRLTVVCRGSYAAADGASRTFSYVAKQFRKKKRARELYDNLAGLGSLLDGSPSVRTPRAVACDPTLGLVLMEELSGTDLSQAMASRDAPAAMRAAGEMLAAFHRAPLRVRETLSIQEQLEDVRESADEIRDLLPAAAPRLERCLARCVSARWEDGTPDVLLHGACRPKHVLIDHGKLAFFDLDGIQMGHPAFDVAHFLSALYYLEEAGRVEAGVRVESAHAFASGYAANAAWRMPAASVLRYIAALLIRKQARKYLVHMHSNPAEKVDRLLTLAERALARAEQLGDRLDLDAIWGVLDGVPAGASECAAD